MIRKLRDSLAGLSARLPDYCLAVRKAGFTSCLVNEDWIELHCSNSDVEVHRRYLVEIAKEVLGSDKPADIIYTDALNCKSSWLNALKARRLTEHGSINEINASWKTQHLEQLSPCLRELLRLSNSSDPDDKRQIATQVAEFRRRRERELANKREEIRQLVRRFPARLDEDVLQAMFANYLYQCCQTLGGALRQTMRPKGQVSIVAFDISGGLVFSITPNVTTGSPQGIPECPSGRLSAAFRLMEKDAVESPIFLRERQLVVPLAIFLPDDYNDYGLFETREEFCLNMLAWGTALSILLPDVLHELRSEEFKAGAPRRSTTSPPT